MSYMIALDCEDCGELIDERDNWQEDDEVCCPCCATWWVVQVEDETGRVYLSPRNG